MTDQPSDTPPPPQQPGVPAGLPGPANQYGAPQTPIGSGLPTAQSLPPGQGVPAVPPGYAAVPPPPGRRRPSRALIIAAVVAAIVVIAVVVTVVARHNSNFPIVTSSSTDGTFHGGDCVSLSSSTVATASCIGTHDAQIIQVIHAGESCPAGTQEFDVSDNTGNLCLDRSNSHS